MTVGMGTGCTDVGAFPLRYAWPTVIPQKGGPGPGNGGSEIQRTRQCVAVITSKIPLGVETARARQKLVVEES